MPLSTNIDQEGLEFISTIEAREFPFYGSQFHPEKIAFEWAPNRPGIPHSRYFLTQFRFQRLKKFVTRFKTLLLKKCS